MARTHRGALAGLLVALASAGSAAAQCGEWSEGFHPSGLDSSVFALQVWDDGNGPALYVGGSFEFARDVQVGGVARWDGAQWSALNGELALAGSSTAWINSFAVHDDGSGEALFAGGRFDAVGVLAAANVARWDGAQWHALGSGLTGGYDVRDLEVYDDGSGGGPQLYAVGRFSTAGGTPAQGVARWDGVAWHAVGNWSDQEISCAEVYDDGSGPQLFVGGTFETPFQAFDGIARWNGSNWKSAGFLESDVFDLEVYDDGSGPRLFAGGGFTYFNGQGISRFAVYNGTGWTAPGCTTDGAVTELESLVEPGKTQAALFLAGSFSFPENNIASWKGNNCKAVGTGINDPISALALFDDGNGPMLYAGGTFSLAGNERADNLAIWDGTRWGPVSTGAGAATQVKALGEADLGNGPQLYGSVGVAPDGFTLSMGRLDGPTWTHIGDIDGEVLSLAAHDDGQGQRLYAGGSFKNVAGVPALRVAAWDGSSWQAVAGGTGPHVIALGSFDFGSGEELVAGGQFQSPEDRIARWNGGASWGPIGGGFDKKVLALATHDEGAGPRLFAGGNLLKILPQGFFVNRLARWSGTQWESVGANDLQDPVNALVSYDPGPGPALVGPALVIGGEFDIQGGSPGDGIIAWDGNGWQSLAGGLRWQGFPGIAKALAVFDDGSGPALYVGGFFDTAGGVPARNIARWDGTYWTPLGEGVDDDVLALVVHDDGTGPALYVGGEFREAGGRAAYHVARWGRAQTCPPLPYCPAGSSALGCVAAFSGAGLASASGATTLDLSVSGAEAGQSGLIFYGVSGPKTTPWTPAGGSTLCVRAPLQRTPVQAAGGTTGACDGGFALDWNAYLTGKPNALGSPFMAGQTVWAQGWLLDPGAPKGSQLSNALEIQIHP